MIVTIQCAARKRSNAGCLRSPDGRPVRFVAEPESAPSDGGSLYARPDDRSGDGRTWRQVLLDYNGEPGGNPLCLMPAWRLYQHPVYARLKERFSVDQLFILSAGWGLLPATFLTPDYDITFSANAERYKRRRASDQYEDLPLAPDRWDEEVVFFGGKDYQPLFARLTASARSQRTVFFNSAVAPTLPGCKLRRFCTNTRTNWHYECAEAFLAGTVTAR